MLTISEIKNFIETDIRSRKKELAKEGQRYYEAEHDIRNYKVFYVNADGNIVEDKTKSNIKISHPFFTELVDQEVQYMLSGKDGYVHSDDPDLQKVLNSYFNDNAEFNAELYDTVTGSASKGFEYMYAYVGADGKTHFQCADSIGVVEVREKESSDGCEYIIYWYIDRINRDNKAIKRIQVWNAELCWYYCQIEDGEIKPDEDQSINPRPHTLFKVNDGNDLYFKDYGFIPFFRLDNNRKQFSDLKPIKQLIDDYDLMSCGLSNNIQDANEVLYVVKGFSGDNLDELMMNVKAKKHIGVDSEGDVDIKTIDIPYEARKTKLELDEKNIYRFGMGFNSTMVGDGNVTNVVIKSRYSLLDMKCNKLEIRLRNFLQKLVKVVLDEVNAENGTDYRLENVWFDFKREIMTNASDNADIEYKDAQKRNVEINTLLNLASYIDNETLMQNICAVLDIDYESIKGKLPDNTPSDPYGM